MCRGGVISELTVQSAGQDRQCACEWSVRGQREAKGVGRVLRSESEEECGARRERGAGGSWTGRWTREESGVGVGA